VISGAFSLCADDEIVSGSLLRALQRQKTVAFCQGAQIIQRQDRIISLTRKEKKLKKGRGKGMDCAKAQDMTMRGLSFLFVKHENLLLNSNFILYNLTVRA
jgi:hypothetical protein